MFVPSQAYNLPTAIVGATQTVTCASGNNVPIPAAVFSDGSGNFYGSGLYQIEVNSSGNNDVQALARITLNPAGVISATAGCFMNNVSTTGAVAGSVSTAPNQIIFILNNVPTLFQNISASIAYSVTAIKIANI
jgi:hypothetical protein